MPPAHVVLTGGRFGEGVSLESADASSFEKAVVDTAAEACRASQPARLGVGTVSLREPGALHDVPAGAACSAIPVLVVRSGDGGKYVSLLVACSLRPLRGSSAGTPGAGAAGLIARYLQEQLLGLGCPVMVIGALAEASTLDVPAPAAGGLDDRDALGVAIADAVESVAARLDCLDDIVLQARYASVSLTAAGPAIEIQAVALGPWRFVAWPQGVSADCVAMLQKQQPGVHVLTLANPLSAGYIVTSETPAGAQLIDRTRQLLAALDRAAD